MNLLIEIKRHPARRSGISVIEVLSAMVVAMIGVFGVMVLIPFAVQQAQSGLDRDEAATVGRNAFAQFEIEGFRLVETRFNPLTNEWVLMTRIANPSPVHPSLPGVVVGPNPGVAVIDPLAVTENGSIPFCGFDTFNFLDSNDAQFSKAMARQMCRSTDDLQFKSKADNPPAGFIEELAPPQQIFDITGSGADARRQSQGRLSWNSVLVPVKADYANTPSGGTPGLTFRMHVLVHKDRDLGLPSVVSYPMANVTAPNNDATGGGDMVGYGGGTVTLDRKLSDVRRDDWVMLKTPADPNNPNLDRNYSNQVGFYRVTTAAEIDVNGNPVSILTLDGQDFNFGPSGTTELHHLVGFRNGRRSGQVVNVYERTMQWERKSNWNKKSDSNP